MSLTIREKGDTVATFRFIAVHLMETLARWVPSTPELEVKVLFGRHLWDLAQHADALGKRTAELRLGLQHSRPPVAAFMEVLESFAGIEDTPGRVDGFYDGMVPILQARYERYLEATDLLMDEPTVRIFERILGDLDRLRAERDELREDRSDLGTADATAQRLVSMADAVDPFVDYRPVPQSSVEAS